MEDVLILGLEGLARIVVLEVKPVAGRLLEAILS
jgi:hypothetical protein